MRMPRSFLFDIATYTAISMIAVFLGSDTVTWKTGLMAISAGLTTMRAKLSKGREEKKDGNQEAN